MVKALKISKKHLTPGATWPRWSPPFCTPSAEGAQRARWGSALWPGGRQQPGAAQANLIFSLITGDSDPGGAEFRPRSEQHPRVQLRPRLPEEWTGRGRGIRGGSQRRDPKLATLGWMGGGASVTTKRCMHQDGLGGLGSVDPEGGVDLVSVLKDTRGLAKKGGHRKPNRGSWVCCVGEAAAGH